ncbi:phospholipase D-like domain-containing protein [Altericroceibacterium spongiae]|uniref:phospholipase D-like domain-containing protein n=1 Tax=Altericroceibacterium spongiae TaxID=2320269 RepID=UPI001EE532AF|nr:phospholipase D-like domain-containing protein [Altericroceibacterium spongiae]
MSETETAEEGFDDSSVEPGVWRYARAERASVIIDAENYFLLMQQAMTKARHRLLLIGWDFDTRIHLAHGRRWWQKAWRRECPSRLGSFILWLSRHNRGLEIRILKWSYGIFKFAARGSMLLDLIRWAPHRRIDFKFDTAHPVGCSHHQKIVVIDDRLAVCGGIDMTTNRWDTREHLEHDPRRKRPRGAEHGPWHDLTMMVEGEAAEALGALGRDRWRRAGGKPLKPVPEAAQSAWPDDLSADFTDVEIGIARTRAEYKGSPAVNEIEDLFVAHIKRARRFIYAESQYFASRRIAETIAERLREENPPEFVIVHARNADGWLEQQAMDHTRSRLVAMLEELDHKRRFHLYSPYTGRTPIYCHAKLMIVDDEILRIGSANFNNRSMGLDSECDVFIDCDRPVNRGCGEQIRRIRYSLLSEHCGVDIEEVGPLIERHGSMAAMIAAADSKNGCSLRPFQPEKLNGVEKTLADNTALDPEEPEEFFEPFVQGRGLFRTGSLLDRARRRLKSRRERRQ